MRKILFRGKRIDNDEWVEGYYWCEYARRQNQHHIYTFEFGEDEEVIITGNAIVDPLTVGQFTGLTDKNGVEIYEGDIVKVDIFTKNYCIVFGESKKWGASFQYKSDFSIYYLTESFTRDCLVIGNIFDNPELL